MTQEQKQFIIKALQSGIPAIAKENIEAVEEAARIAAAPQEELNGQEEWVNLNQFRHEVIVETIHASYPFIANELLGAYYTDVNAAQEKFNENIRVRKEREAAEANPEDAAPADKKKKSE